MSMQEAVQLLQAAIEASIYVEPKEPGLTAAELQEVGKQAGLRDGELGDAIRELIKNQPGGRDRRVLLDEGLWHLVGLLTFKHDPELRKPEAYDFVVSQLIELERDVGKQNARIARTVLVSRADESLRHDVEVAIMFMVFCNVLAEQEGMLRFKHQHFMPNRPLPSDEIRMVGPTYQKGQRSRMFLHVRDVIGRRTDGRAKAADPLGAFAEQLDRLGYGRLRGWWHQTLEELNRTNSATSPLSATVLAAALVEGALTFIVDHGKKLGIGRFNGSDFTGSPRTWRIERLVTSAAHNEAILDGTTKHLADALIQTRQRVHAGRMIEDFTGPVPDLRPEQAREARIVAERVVRAVIDWLDRNPPS